MIAHKINLLNLICDFYAVTSKSVVCSFFYANFNAISKSKFLHIKAIV